MSVLAFLVFSGFCFPSAFGSSLNFQAACEGYSPLHMGRACQHTCV